MKTRAAILIIFSLVFNFRAEAQEDEIKDTPYFSGMNDFTIYDGEDIE